MQLVKGVGEYLYCDFIQIETKVVNLALPRGDEGVEVRASKRKRRSVKNESAKVFIPNTIMGQQTRDQAEGGGHFGALVKSYFDSLVSTLRTSPDRGASTWDQLV